MEITVTKEMDGHGNTTITQTKKITYSQDWPAYDRAQTSQKEMFMSLLADLCGSVPESTYAFGRPRMPMRDMVFSAALKVFTTFSLRRFATDVRAAKELGYITKTPHYSTVALYMENAELTPVIKELIRVSSLPLKSVESDFAVDASGFSTSRFARWFDFRYGKSKGVRIWIKAHLMSGVKTNIVTAAEVTAANTNDAPMMAGLLRKTAENFGIKELSADMAYSSRANLTAVEDVGGVPYVPFRKGAVPKALGSAAWHRMWYYFMYKHEEFIEHYHKRSNAETVFHMIKSKFGDAVRSRNETAQVNEVLLKVLCHNICVVIQEIHELGIEPKFVKTRLQIKN